MVEFVALYQRPVMAIDTQFDQEMQRHLEDNMKVVEALLGVVMLCGKQGLSLRGHCDDSIVWEGTDVANEGNFIEMVRFRAETDEVLRKHLAKSP